MANENKVLVIDNDLRTIRPPVGMTNIGVAGDRKVTRLGFKMPRYYGGFDLSSFAISINYFNAIGEGDVGFVSGITVEDSAITFTWLVEEFMTLYSGKVRLSVHLEKKNGTKVEKVFNTGYFSTVVLETLDPMNQIEETLPSVVQQFKEELFGQFDGRIDSTLKYNGMAADAGATGDRITKLEFGMSSPFNFKGSTTYAKLPKSGNTVNDTYYCTDKKCRYSWNGSAWYQSSMNESDYADELTALSDKTLINRSTSICDANQCTQMGIYAVSSQETWINLPDGASGNGGVLVVMGANTTTNCYQMFIEYKDSTCYRRNRMKNVFNDWEVILTPLNIHEYNKMKFVSVDDELDLNTMTESGFYFISSAATVKNLPVANNTGGLLRYYYDEHRTGTNRNYQEYYDWATGNYYYRHDKYGTFGKWKRVATEDDISTLTALVGTQQKGYTIQKLDTTKLYVFKQGRRGFIRYEYRLHTDEAINLRTWRLGRIDLCDSALNVSDTISTAGADNEGVLRLDGEDDYIGGVHGDEQYTGFYVFVDGEEYTIQSLPDNMPCEEIRFVVKSNISHCNTTDICIEKVKQTTFDSTGVHVNNRWTCLEDLDIYHVRAILLSVNKTCISKYYDSTVYTVPEDVPETGGGKTNNNMIDTYYMGNISAHVWCGERGGDESMYAGSIADFGDRLKSYFDCYKGHKASEGEVLYCQNNFYITC